MLLERDDRERRQSKGGLVLGSTARPNGDGHLAPVTIEPPPRYAPFALTVPKGKQWYLVYRDFRKDQRDFVAFRKWLLRASRQR